MPYRICKTFTVENGHLLSKHPGACRFPHGHSRQIEIVLEADTLDANDMVCDFKRLKTLVENYIATLDHAMCLNTQDPHFSFYQKTYGDRIVAFENVDPTSELMAERIFNHAETALKRLPGSEMARRVSVVRVRVHETNTSWAEFGRSVH
jgi:6-pyruvoyltetrahydropterin/6-carboxytetrahydropterin synthase